MSRRQRGKRVLMVTASEMATDARICREAEALANAGYAVEILCLKADLPAHARGVVLVEQDYRSIPRKWRLPAIVARMSLSAVMHDADIYHAHNIPALPSCWVSARLRGARLVYDAHELYAACLRPAGNRAPMPISWRSRTEASVERSLARRADLHLTVSVRYAEEIERALHLPAPTPVPNYPPLPADGVDPALRLATGVDDDQVLLLYQGGYYLATRALDVVIEGMNLLPSNYHLALLGFGPHGEERTLEGWIRDAGAESRVTMLPPVPHQELARWTSGADIGLIPFRLDHQAMVLGSPNKLYEYMGSGVAVLSSAAEELAEVLAETGAGVTYDPASPQDFAARVQSLGSDRNTLKAIGRRGRIAAEEKYSWEAVQDVLLDAYVGLGANA